MQVEKFYVEPADWKIDNEDIVSVRTEVFIVEQECPEDEEFDEDDLTCQHFLARSVDDKSPVGTARLTSDGRIGRMAVLDSWRGEGVGAALLRACIDRARLNRYAEVRLGAQVHALGFYQREGFEAFGETYDEIGIEHRWMRLDLNENPLDVNPVERRDRKPADVFQLGLETGHAKGLTTFTERTVGLIQSAVSEIVVFTRDLDLVVTNNADVVSALEDYLAYAREPQLKVLVLDSMRAAADGSRWASLLGRRSSAGEIRNPIKPWSEEISAFMIVDRRHLLHRPLGDRWESHLTLHSLPAARKWQEFFDGAWEHGVQDPNFRRLDL